MPFFNPAIIATMKEVGDFTSPEGNRENEEDDSTITLSAEELIQRTTELQSLNNLATNSKYVEANTLLPGIYGFVEDATTGEKITLSLTPYEIAPRLSDNRLFTPNGNFSPGLSTAMTVGNRLQSSRVFTNFMQEVLPPAGEDGNTNTDIRFISKDDRIGQLSRFISTDGQEADKSTFLHIVPDVDATGGKVEIAYAKYDKDGTRLEKNGIAYLPVNFNFISSKYSLTINEFIIENVQEASREIYSLNKSFDGYTLRLFGQHPQIMSFSGVLTNFNDDTIGIDSNLLKQIGFNGDELSGNGYIAPSKGSQRDVFIAYYENFLAGTKCRDYSMKVFFYYNHRVMEGYLIEMTMSSDSQNDNVVRFGGNMIIKRKYSTFETGSGLANTLPATLRDRNFSGFGLDLDNTVFDSEKSYRNNYREYALSQSKNLIQNAAGLVKSNVPNIINSENIFIPNTTIKDDWINDPAQFNKTSSSQDMTYLTAFIDSIINAMVTLTGASPVGLETSIKVKQSITTTLDYILSNCAISYDNFFTWLFTNKNKSFYLFQPQIGDSDTIFAALLTMYPYPSCLNSYDQSTKPYKIQPISKIFRACYQGYFDTPKTT